MKKTLLAAALLTGGFAGTAMAQNSVTLYGRIVLGYAYDNVRFNDTAKQNLGVTNGTRNQFEMAQGYAPGSSLWGIRGVEDLGNGLRAEFNYEAGVAADTGAAGNFSRRSFVALSSNAWGRVSLGRDFHAASNMLAGIDPFGAAWGFASGNLSMGLFSVNQPNQVKYTTPTFSGFQGSVSYSTAGTAASILNEQTGGTSAVTETFGTSTKNRWLSLGLRYANGPILLGAAYDQQNLANNAANTTPKTWLVGGTYDFKIVKLHGAYGQSIDGFLTGTGARTGLGVDGNFGAIGAGSLVLKGARTNNWLLGLSAPVGDSGRVLVSFQQKRPGGAFNDVGATQNAMATSSTIGVGYSYSLSARTSVFASYNYAKNLYMVNGVNANQVGVGVVHNF